MRYFAYALSSYWLSPSVSTAVGCNESANVDVASCLHAFAVPLPPLKFFSVGSQAMSPTAATTGSAPGAAALPWSASRYAPYPDGEAHCCALSTAVPSPHSLNVVTSWNRACDATMSRIELRHRWRSRGSRGAGSSAFANPGLIVYDHGAKLCVGVAGAYWCQLSAAAEHDRKPANTFSTTYAPTVLAACQRCAIAQASFASEYTKTTNLFPTCRKSGFFA